MKLNKYTLVLITTVISFFFCSKNEHRKDVIIDKSDVSMVKEDTLTVIKDSITPKLDTINVESSIVKIDPINCDSLLESLLKQPGFKRNISNDELKGLIREHLTSVSYLCYSNRSSHNIVVNNKELRPLSTYLTNIIMGVNNYYYSSTGLHLLLKKILKNDNPVELNACDSIFKIGIRKIIGINPILKDQPFKFINPIIVKWGAENLIPAPEDTLLGYSFQEIYNTLFAHEIRQHYLTLSWLERNPEKLKEECQLYKDTCSKKNFYGPQYFRNRFEYMENLDEELIGFWLRRYWDGSFNEVKSMLLKVIRKYDAKYLENIMLKNNYFVSIRNRMENVSTIGDTIVISYTDFDLYIFGLINGCGAEHFNREQFDTLNIDVSGIDGCAEGEIKSMAIVKTGDYEKIEFTLKAVKNCFIQLEPEKGGVGIHDSISVKNSEQVILSQNPDGTIIFPNIFDDSKFKWEKYTDKETGIINRSKKSAGFIDVLPESQTIKIKWRKKNQKEAIERYIRLHYSYGC